MGKGTAEDILVPIPAGANGNVTNAGPKRRGDFMDFEKLGLLSLCMPV